MEEHSNRSTRPVLVVVIVLLVLAGSAGAWYWLQYKPEQEAKEKARLEQIAKEKAEKEAAEQAEQNKAKYGQLIEDADVEFDQENWETAQSLYTEASVLFPDQQYPKDQLALVNAKLDELAALEASRAAGIIETVSSPTGRYYVIVSSSIDDDLAMDYAIKLAREGNNVKIIEDQAIEHSYYRVTLGDYPTWEQAEAALTTFGSYGDDVWVLKY